MFCSECLSYTECINKLYFYLAVTLLFYCIISEVIEYFFGSDRYIQFADCKIYYLKAKALYNSVVNFSLKTAKLHYEIDWSSECIKINYTMWIFNFSEIVKQFFCFDDPPSPHDSLEESRVSMSKSNLLWVLVLAQFTLNSEHFLSNFVWEFLRSSIMLTDCIIIE